MVVGVVSSYVLQPKGMRPARNWRRLRRYRGDPRWQGLRKPYESQPVRFPEEHHDLRHFRNPDGPLAPFVTHAMTQETPWVLQHWRFLYARGAALLPSLECLFHEESSRGRTREFRRIFFTVLPQATCLA